MSDVIAAMVKQLKVGGVLRSPEDRTPTPIGFYGGETMPEHIAETVVDETPIARLTRERDEARAELREIVERAHRSLQMSWNPELDEIVEDARSKLMEWEGEQP